SRATPPTLADALTEAEEVLRVVPVLHAPQARVVRAVVGAGPVAKLGVDVVHVGLARDVRAKRRVEAAHPVEVARRARRVVCRPGRAAAGSRSRAAGVAGVSVWAPAGLGPGAAPPGAPGPPACPPAAAAGAATAAHGGVKVANSPTGVARRVKPVTTP